MKKLVTALTVVLLLVIGVVYAQMGGGMTGSQGGHDAMSRGMMGGQEGHMHEGSMLMHGHEMSGSMMPMMNHMGSMMQRITGFMEKGMGTEQMKGMSEIARDMSTHMMDMSNMLKRGEASHEDMHKLHQRIMETEKKFNMIKK